MGKNCSGRSGADRVVRVPPGTLIYDRELNVLLKDLDEPDMTESPDKRPKITEFS